MNNISPSVESQQWLIAGLSLGALLHFRIQPVWIALFFIFIITGQWYRLTHPWHGKDRQIQLRYIRPALTLSVFALLINHYGTLIGRDAGVGLLIMMLSLKLTELRQLRDFYLICFLGYFLIVTNFFYSQDMMTAIIMMADIVLLTTALLSLNDRHALFKPTQKLQFSATLLLQALPLMVVCFIFFPRVDGPLWGLPADAYTATTGIDNKMTLGKISQLIQSDDIAFRVKFKGAVPPHAELYWRGPVLWHTDGTTWTELDTSRQRISPPHIISASSAYTYAMTLEATNQTWLFALDMPARPAPHSDYVITADGQLRSKDKIKHRLRYTARAFTHYRFNPEGDKARQAALALPPDLHPKTRVLAQQWRTQYHSPRRIIKQALDFFVQQHFIYTLSPPMLSGDKIDQFLFESRQGFCEHFAASFTVLMRAAGIPARIVIGYQGGEINPVDHYLVIRQRDAHAWSEVWLPGQGWIRVDPTAMVATQRINEGINTLIPASQRAPLLLSHNRTLVALWQDLRDNWDALDNKWNQWILAYGPKLQRDFLTQLGFHSPDWLSMTLYLFIALNMVVLVLSGMLFYQHQRQDPAVRLYRQFCHKIARLGLTRLASEGPEAFAKRVVQQFPELTDPVSQITRIYIELRYSPSPPPIHVLQRAVKSFTPSRILR